MTRAATGPAIDLTTAGTSERCWMAELERRCPPLPELDVRTPGRVVIVSPHPDDEVLGAGGLLRQLVRAGWRAEVIALTDGEAAFGSSDAQLRRRRQAEQVQALDLLLRRKSCTPQDVCAPHVSLHRVGVSDGQISAELDHVIGQLDARLRGADLCVAPWFGDGHPDHEAAGQASERAAGARHVPLLRYPIWLWHWAVPARDLPWDRVRLLPLSQCDRSAKVCAIRAYTSQLGDDGRQDPILTPSVLAHFARPFELFVA